MSMGPQEELKAALSIRGQFDQQLKEIENDDYDEPDDKLPF